MKTYNFLFPARLVAALSLAVCAVLMPNRAPAKVYDVVADFSTNANPNGVWSYGWATNVGGQFMLMTNRASYQAAAGYWNGLNVPDACYMQKDFGGSIFYEGTVSFCPDTLQIDPQSYAVIVRFTAPSNGSYQVQGLFRLQSTAPHAHNLNIQINNTITAYYFNTAGGANGTEYPFSFPCNLNQGDTLDFVVSCYNGDYSYLSSGLKATVSPLTTNGLSSCFDAVADFSTNANPNGVWSYGYFTNFSYPFQLLTTNSYPVVGVPEVFAWWDGGDLNILASVIVAGNFTDNPVSETIYPNVIFYPDTLLEDPEDFVVTVRFTAPMDGIYNIQGFFRLQDTTTSYDNAHVVMVLTNINTSSPVFYQLTPAQSFGTEYPFNSTNFLTKGTPLDFIVSCTSNGHGLSTGVKATVTPLSPILMTQPTNQTVAQEGPAVFSVTAWGTPPLSYQWFRAGAPLSDGGRISGSGTNQLTITGALAADATNYTVVVTNTFGSVTSTPPVMLTVIIPVQIQSPQLAGTNFTFSFSTVSDQSYTVQQCTNLLSNNWIFYTNITGNGSLYQLLAPVSSKRQQFFRVREP